MGSNTLNTKNPGDVIASEDPNQYKTAVDGNLVPRDTGGIATDLAGSLGETLLRWFRLFVTKITLGDPDDDVHLEQTAGTMTIKSGDVVKFSLDANGFDGSYTSSSTRLKIQSQEFTSNGTFDMPTGITKVFIYAVGGGGGGGGGGNSNPANGGGGGGAGCEAVWTLIDGCTPDTPYVISLGAGGAGGASNNTGSSGTATTFGGITVALGARGGFNGYLGIGEGGRGGGAYNGGGRGGGGTAGGLSDEGMQSGLFAGGTSTSHTDGGGGGGASSFGSGANGASTGAGAAATSTSYGAGGAGGANGTNAGGAGANGYLKVIWFDHP